MDNVHPDSAAEYDHADKSSELDFDSILDSAGDLATDLLKLLIHKHCLSPVEEEPTDCAYTKQTVDFLPGQATHGNTKANSKVTAVDPESLKQDYATFPSCRGGLPGSSTSLGTQ